VTGAIGRPTRYPEGPIATAAADGLVSTDSPQDRAIDPVPSGAGRDELLMSSDECQAAVRLRRPLAALDPQQVFGLLLVGTSQTAANADFPHQNDAF